MTTLPAPVQPKSSSMPGDHRVRRFTHSPFYFLQIVCTTCFRTVLPFGFHPSLRQGDNGYGCEKGTKCC